MLTEAMPFGNLPAMPAGQNEMTVSEFARLGGHARAEKLTQRRRKQIARKGGRAHGKRKNAGDQVCESGTLYG